MISTQSPSNLEPAENRNRFMKTDSNLDICYLSLKSGWSKGEYDVI